MRVCVCAYGSGRERKWEEMEICRVGEIERLGWKRKERESPLKMKDRRPEVWTLFTNNVSAGAGGHFEFIKMGR